MVFVWQVFEPASGLIPIVVSINLFILPKTDMEVSCSFYYILYAKQMFLLIPFARWDLRSFVNLNVAFIGTFKFKLTNL